MKISTIKKGDWGKIKAFFTLEIDGLYFSGFKICEAMNGDMWVAFPSRKNKEGEYENTVVGKSEASIKVRDLALEAYKNIGGEVKAEEGKKETYDDGIPF